MKRYHGILLIDPTASGKTLNDIATACPERRVSGKAGPDRVLQNSNKL